MPGAHLDQAVEAPPTGPRSLPAVGVEAGRDQARVDRRQLVGAEAEALHRTGAQSVHDDVGVAQQGDDGAPAVGAGQVEGGTALADGGVGQQRGDVVEAGRIDAQHVGAERGEDAGADRPGDDPGQVEHADPGQRSPRGRRRPRRGGGPTAPCSTRRSGSSTVAFPCGWARHAPVVCMAAAAPPAATTSASSAVGRRQPHAGGHLVGPGAGGEPEHAQRGGAVVGVVGVQADPPVGGRVVTAHRVEERRRGSTRRARRPAR